MDSALGRQCGSIALFAKGTNAKFANLSQKAQSSHSPTANPRILEEDKHAQSLESTFIVIARLAARQVVAKRSFFSNP